MSKMIYTKTIKYKNGNYELFYFNENTLYRTDGPAEITYNKKDKIIAEYYVINDKLHRVDGPALIEYFFCKDFFFNLLSHEEYFINGHKLSKKEYYKKIKLLCLQ